jgi:pilus assembly protein CpaC
MTHQIKHKDIIRGYRRIKRAGALLTAATGAILVLLGNGTTAGQTNGDSAPTTRPSMVSDGVDNDGSLRLTVGKSTVLTVRKAISRLNIGSPEIADYNAISPTSILITAKKAGSTGLIIWDDQNHSEVVNITVEADLGTLRRQIKESFPGLEISATPLNDTIALRGQVPSAQTAEQLVEMASTYAKVHNFLEISGGQQVMLQVRFAEVSKSAIRNLGVTFGGTDGVSAFSTNGIGSGTSAFSGTTPGLGLTTGTATSGVTLFGQGKVGAIAFDYFVNALRQNGLVRVLAEPNLIATSGQTASFLAGGQVPIPVPQPGNGGSTITIEYHDYGVRLNFTPQVLGDSRIRLKVTPEVSDLDYSDAVSVAGTSVPGFTDRKVDTTVELGDGQSFALAGLLNDKTSATTTGIPFLDRIPVLGDLFSSVQYTRNETELVVLVTPRLVGAMNPDQIPPLPGEKWRSPNDVALYIAQDLGGPAVEQGKGSADKKTASPPPRFHGSYGFSAVRAGSVQPVDADPVKAR